MCEQITTVSHGTGDPDWSQGKSELIIPLWLQIELLYLDSSNMQQLE